MMFENILTLLHGTFILIYGLLLTASFTGLRFTRRNFRRFLVLFAFTGALQLAFTFVASEAAVWQLYPLITHTPLILLLRHVYRKPLPTAIAATFTAYLCCQPSKWFGVLAYQLTSSVVAELSVRILVLIPMGYVIIRYLAPHMANIFSKDKRSVCIFGFFPTVYYVFDYVTAVYTGLWISNARVVMEFMPFLLALLYMSFCVLYHKEYEQKADAQRNEQIIRIAVEKQAKEISTTKQREQEIRLLRHDMRHLLSSLSISLENGDLDTAQKIIEAHTDRIGSTEAERFCSCDIVNYVISDYLARCNVNDVSFSYDIELEELRVDEMMFASILANALDNALNAQKLLSVGKRQIKLMLKNSDDKLLLSVKNPVGQRVVFSDGLPVSRKDGHGYGTQSIRYLTEKLGGSCQFSTEDNMFLLRVVLNTPSIQNQVSDK